MKEKNLFRKLIYIVPLLLTGFLFFYLLIIFFFNLELLENKRQQNRLLAFSLSQNALNEIIAGDLQALQKFTDNAIKNPGVIGAEIRNSVGKILISSRNKNYKELTNKKLTTFTLWENQKHRDIKRKYGKQEIIRTDIPIIPVGIKSTIKNRLKSYGYVSLYAAINKSNITAQTKYIILLLAGSLLLLSIIIIFLAFSFFIIPLKKINRAALELKHKHYKFRIPEKTKHHREFAALYHRINRIAQMLETKEKKYLKSKHKLKKLEHDIDNIIKKHTSKIERSSDRIKKAQNELMQLSAMSLSNEIKSQIIEATANPITNSMLILQDKLPKMLIIDKGKILNDIHPILDKWNRLFKDNKLSNYFAAKKNMEQTEIQSEFNQLFSSMGTINETNELILRFFFIFEKEFSRFVQIINDLKSNIINTRNVRKISLKDTLKNVITILEQKINDDRVKIKIICTEKEPTVQADKNDIIYVFYNIILNSLNAFKTKPLLDHRITIAIEDKDQKHTKIIFEDNGPGIDDKDMQQIFTPGFSADNKSLGYGLSVSSNIIQSYNGKITLIKSERNTSTVFEVKIPKAN